MSTLTLKKLAVRGAFWTVANYGTSQILRFGGNLLLTRLLYPEFFGLMALVNIFVIGLKLFSDVGIGLSIVQNKRGEEPAFVNTAWTIQVIRGFLLWGLCLLIAYPISLLYDNAQLLWLLPMVGVSTILDGFSAMAPFQLERRLDLSKLMFLELTTQMIHLIVMIVWAYLSPTILAIVVGGWVSGIVRMVLTYRLIPGYRNYFKWDKTAASEIFAIGRWVFLSTALTFLAEQADRLLLGRLLSLELLGIYGIALMMGDVPRQIAMALGHRVILPAASKLVDLPRAELRRKILPHRLKLLLLLMLGILILAGGGDLIVNFLYDERYAAAAWMLPILALGMWPRLLCATIEASLYAIGKMQYTTFANFCRLISTTVGISIGFYFFQVPGAIVAVSLNDFFYYISVSFGLHREGLGCLRQDAQVTSYLVGILLLMMFVRMRLGLGLPFEGMF
ncbi:MAG: oligosaccharide flippase family protein [Oculatellaceae cyanobacterium Prado106]|jgi:O-antigen/teichoic acid export membrane protein|nr:oligosaccharide flippase family protein [Oculatellaceae cyanobacterium Prado106]